MEVPIEADAAGEVIEVLCSQGASISAGEALLVLRPEVWP